MKIQGVFYFYNMASFITHVLKDLVDKGYNLSELHFILPSKRAGVFLKNNLANFTTQPIFSPKIESIEDFVTELSELQPLQNTQLLFLLYEAYIEVFPKAQLESFESFLKWAQLLLQDFNEIDRYLLEPNSIFDYLKAIKEINHWSVSANQTQLIKNHLQFWNSLKLIYHKFTEKLLQSKQGYQGLIYREATENLEAYIQNHPNKTHIFLGFNALNTAESKIIQELLHNDLAQIYWDIDSSFLANKNHNAGLFIRQYLNQWPYFKTQPLNWQTKHYQDKKHIEVIGIPKHIGQAKYIGQLLSTITKDNKDLTNTAVVLGEEQLVLPTLNALPKQVSHVNITMGLPLKTTPTAAFFELLFGIHTKNTNTFYYKEVISLLSHPLIYPLLNTKTENLAETIINHINTNNIVNLSFKDIIEIDNQNLELVQYLFGNWEDNPNLALQQILRLITQIKNHLSNKDKKELITLETLYHFHKLFNQLQQLCAKNNYVNNIKTLQSLYNELLTNETLNFKGEPLQGLQIMGMLETRVLDFDTLIISGVNEGILPSGKNQNSFIPFDVKIENGLPTYKEKDAVYTYHFFRLLQRAKTIYILYNTEIDTLKGGEKSRFITQLEIENIHNINHSIATSQVPKLNQKLQVVKKTPQVLEQIQRMAAKGFSPSSLTNYIRNPIDFYIEKILGITNFEDVEEHIAANTLGSVIHNTLEHFYKPFEGQLLTIEGLTQLKKQIKPEVTTQFKTLYGKGDFTKGKNLIIFEIAQRYILNFIASEIENLKQGNTIKIIAIEVEETASINIKNLNFPINIIGKVDRIDSYNGVTRVIDYKTGKVAQNQVEIVDWENLTTDYDKYSKSFQLLCYAYMMHKNQKITLPVEAGIISFKNLKEGVLRFAQKPTPFSKTKNYSITKDTLNSFENALKALITEIYNPELNFEEKEV